MSTIDRLLMDAQAALMRRDLVAYNNILDEVERIKRAETKRAEWSEKKAKGANEHKN